MERKREEERESACPDFQEAQQDVPRHTQDRRRERMDGCLEKMSMRVALYAMMLKCLLACLDVLPTE